MTFNVDDCWDMPEYQYGFQDYCEIRPYKRPDMDAKQQLSYTLGWLDAQSQNMKRTLAEMLADVKEVRNEQGNL